MDGEKKITDSKKNNFQTKTELSEHTYLVNDLHKTETHDNQCDHNLAITNTPFRPPAKTKLDISQGLMGNQTRQMDTKLLIMVKIKH